MTNTVEEALAFMRRQAETGAEWRGLCQMLCRSSYGLGGGFGSAWLQWLGLPSDQKVVAGAPGGSMYDAPLGAPLFFKGSGPYGHVMLKKRPNSQGAAQAWSNDLVVVGKVHAVAVNAPVVQWNQKYLGWGKSLNGVLLPLGGDKPKPQDKPYAGIEGAINALKAARETARKQKDWKDARRLSEEIVRLRKMYNTMRRH